MFAVIETGGKQYRVREGDVVDIELLQVADEEPVEFSRILVAGEGADVKVGSPLLADAKVTGTCLGAVRGPKLIIFKKKRRKGYKRTNGHRQDLQRVRIDSISV